MGNQDSGTPSETPFIDVLRDASERSRVPDCLSVRSQYMHTCLRSNYVCTETIYPYLHCCMYVCTQSRSGDGPAKQKKATRIAVPGTLARSTRRVAPCDYRMACTSPKAPEDSSGCHLCIPVCYACDGTDPNGDGQTLRDMRDGHLR